MFESLNQMAYTFVFVKHVKFLRECEMAEWSNPLVQLLKAVWTEVWISLWPKLYGEKLNILKKMVGNWVSKIKYEIYI